MLSDEVSKGPQPASNDSKIEHIKLISGDKHEFIIRKSYIMCSHTIRSMLTGPGQETGPGLNEVYLREISSHILHKMCQYFVYKAVYNNNMAEIPEFSIEPEISLDLLMAANFLDC